MRADIKIDPDVSRLLLPVSLCIKSEKIGTEGRDDG
jgi:hypothetical protein